MGKVRSEAGLIRITLHHDNKTPEEFVLELLCIDLRRPYSDAIKAIDAAAKHGQAICGTYPRDVGTKFLEAAQKRIGASGRWSAMTAQARSRTAFPKSPATSNSTMPAMH